MKTYRITVSYMDNGKVRNKALFMVEDESEEAAKKKLESALKNDPPHKITDVTE